MASSPPSGPAASGSGGRAPALQAGLDALDRRDYAAAIAAFQTACRDSPSPRDRLQARMGLTNAYRRSGQIQAALDCCKPLTAHGSDRVRGWAERMRATLQAQAAKAQAAKAAPATAPSGDRQAGNAGFAGFVPLDAEPLDPGPPPENAGFTPLTEEPPPGDAGFVLLDAEPLDAGPPPENAGFTPLTEEPPPIADRPAIAPPPVPGNRTAPRVPAPPPRPAARSRDTSPGDAPIADAAPAPGTLPVTGPGAAPEVAREGAPGIAPKADPEIGPEIAPEIGPEIEGDRAESYVPQWRNAPRAKHWQALPETGGVAFWLLQGATVVAFGWLVRALFLAGCQVYNETVYTLQYWLHWIPLVDWLQAIYEPPVWVLWALLAIAVVASSWLWDEGLKRVCGQKPLRLTASGGSGGEALRDRSPEACRLLQRQCRQAGIPVPALRYLPTPLPLAFSYGAWPHKARIALSQGAIDALEPDELAALVAAEGGRIARWETAVLSGGVLALQVPYAVYWQAAKAADGWTMPLSRGGAIALSALAYGIFRLLRWPLLALARQQARRDDRRVAGLAGNPNARARALVKLAIATAAQMDADGRTDPKLEALELLLPVGYRAALPLGSLWPRAPLEPYLWWERANPYRHWLVLNQAHPLTGDRLAALAALARRWHLEPEWDLDEAAARAALLPFLPPRAPRSPRPVPDAGQLWLQSAPFLGIVLGCGLGLLLWIPGAVGLALESPALRWLYGDRSVVYGLVAVGTGFGIFLRVNRLFPEIKALNLPTAGPADAALLARLWDPHNLPLTGQPLCLEGVLHGRSASHNGVAQDCWLQTETGAVRLHCTTRWGPLGWLWRTFRRSPLPLGRPVRVTGWLRRGAVPWMDAEAILPRSGSRSAALRQTALPRDAHSLFSTALGALTTAVGLYWLYRGL